MTLLAFLFAIPVHAQAAKPQLHCTAVYRTLDAQAASVERRAALAVKTAPEGLVRQEATLEGRVFSLTEDRDELFGQIRLPGDESRGTAVKGAADRQGHFSIAEVSGFTAFRLECDRSAN